MIFCDLCRIHVHTHNLEQRIPSYATRVLFLLVILALTAGPTFYIAIVDNRPAPSQIPLYVGIAQFFISVVVTMVFGLLPSGRMFGDRVAGKSRKYMASQTFTASYPAPRPRPRTASIMLWLLIFSCKFVESYFFLTSSFSSPIAVMARTKVQGCSDKYFGNALCTNQVPFTLTIMYVMDLILFFLDTYLWYIIWNVVFSVGRSFSLGLSIWTPWKDIYTRLPKRIYAKLLATGRWRSSTSPRYIFSFEAVVHLFIECYTGPRFSNLECRNHFHVPRASSIYRPRTTASLPPGRWTGRPSDSSRTAILH